MLLTLLALAAPLPAMALNSDGSEPPAAVSAPAALSVSTALDNCGLVETQVVCKLNVSFEEIEGADSYSATVTRADGSVVDYGTVGDGGAALWVPYVGAGSYSVRISAFGPPPADGDGKKDEEDDPGNLITSETAEAKPDQRPGNATIEVSPGQRGEPRGGNASQNADAGADPSAAEPAQPEPCESKPPMPADPLPEPPPLPEEPPEDLDPENPDEDADGVPDADEQAAYDAALAEHQAAALAAQGELPESIDCPARP